MMMKDYNAFSRLDDDSNEDEDYSYNQDFEQNNKIVIPYTHYFCSTSMMTNLSMGTWQSKKLRT